MSISESSTQNLFNQIAKAADLCLKPWRHSVIDNSPNQTNDEHSYIDLILHIETRNKEGERLPQHDLELEIFKSGIDLSITLAWSNYEQQPILWQGHHSIWMDALTGKRCDPPTHSGPLEALGRRVRTLLVPVETNQFPG